MYRALVELGVKFEFFHKVEKLNLSDDLKSVSGVDIGVQATVKHGFYDPLIGPIKDLMCWPTRPKYELLNEGKDIKAQGVNLESWWTPGETWITSSYKRALITTIWCWGFP